MLSELYVTGIKLSSDIPAGSYLRGLPVVRHLQKMGELPISRRVTFFVGENGVGKSTLIEAIAVSMGFNPEGGTINFNFATADSHSDLYRHLTVCKGVKRHRDGFFLRAESFYNVASNIDEMDSEASGGAPLIMRYGGVSFHKQSHGESFMALWKTFGETSIHT
jgi:predicted ATPase